MQRFSHDKPCSDHLGNIYGSIKAMCSFWHINPETFSRRLTVYNMTVEEALTRPVKHNGVRGKMILPSHGKEFFTFHGKHFFTLCGKQFFTRVGKHFLT